MNVYFCLGLPRSGTSALARIFNLKDDVFCGFELCPFPDHVNRTLTTKYIEDLLSSDDGIDQKLNQAVYQRKSGMSLSAIGNKEPLYYQLLNEVAQANPGAPFITIYRDIPFVIKSCNTRAAGTAVQWPSGLIGALSGYMIADMCHCVLSHSKNAKHYIFEYDSLLFGELRRQHIAHLFEAIGSELDSPTYEIFATKQSDHGRDGIVDPTYFSDNENNLIRLLETDRLKQIFTSFSGRLDWDFERRIDAWLADYVGKAPEIENRIIRQLKENPDLDVLDSVSGLMVPFGAPISSAIAFGHPCGSAFVQIPQLRTETQAGRTLSHLLETVDPNSFDNWEKGNGVDELKAILGACDDELWRALACRILIKAANLAGKHEAVYLMIETYDGVN